jgi:outer membrane protein
MNKLILLPTLLCFTLSKAQQSQANAFGLQQAIEYAIKHSPNYLNAEEDQKAALYKRNEIAGLGLPQIMASADLKNYLEIPTSLIPGEIVGGPAGSFVPVRFGTKYNSTAGFSATQLLFSSDYIFGVRAAKEFINLSRINVVRSKADLVAEVSKAYYNSIINKQRIKLLEANLLRLKKLFDDTKAMNQQGFVELIDVERIEVQYNNLLSEMDKVARLLAFSENLVKFQMGYKISEPIFLSDTLFEDEGGNNVPVFSKMDIARRPEFQLAVAQQKLLDIDLKRMRWGYMPTVAAFGAYQYNAQRQKFDFFDGEQNWFRIALIGVSVNFSLFDGFQRHYQIQQAGISLRKSMHSLQQLQLAVELETAMSEISYSNAFSNLQIQKKNMNLAAHVFEVAQKKYLSGVGSNLEVMNAEAGQKEAQTNYFNAVYDLLVAKIDYQKASGTLVK